MDDTSPLPIFIFLIILKYLYTFQVLFGSIDFYEGEIYVCLKILRLFVESVLLIFLVLSVMFFVLFVFILRLVPKVACVSELPILAYPFRFP
jgi:hypothetical protein